MTSYKLKIIVILLFYTAVFPQKKDSLIQIYPGLGDTLFFAPRSYLGLFPEVENFKDAVFYIQNKEKLITKISYYDSSKTEVKILESNLESLDSIRTIIQRVSLINAKLLEKRHDFTLQAKNGDLIKGELEMFDENYVYFFAEGITADHIGKMHYRFPISEIEKFTLEGNNNILLGTCGGAAVGGVVSLILISVDKSSSSHPVESCLSPAFKAGAVAAGVVLAAGIGLLIGAISSTEDQHFYFNNEYDVLKLQGHSAFVLDKNLLKKFRYHNVY